jgi:hypothetical protein
MKQIPLSHYYRTFDLPASAIDFARERLSEGLSLAQMVSKLPFSGKAQTFAPVFAREEKLQHYAHTIWGWLSAQENEILFRKKMEEKVQHAVCQLWLLPLIMTYLNEDRNNLCVLEDYYAKPGQPDHSELMDSGLPYAVFENEVYIPLSYEHTEEQVMMALTWVGLGHEIGVLTRCQSDCQAHSQGQFLHYQDLQSWASNKKKVFISAYDDETYLLLH